MAFYGLTLQISFTLRAGSVAYQIGLLKDPDQHS